ncbi:MAG: EscU/YscU/HrcU family type III secretion system export apparatus switch protein [Gammaproteobacteria bacterium]|nr:EscU/YscU/HrcU family type III secretion system export apparatus switch protein [Gammaproteobacteria bacterium]
MAREQPVNVAVALHWDGQSAPRVTAKGRGEVAERILELARKHNVPVDQEPALIEVLAEVELGRQIPDKLFVAIAQVIAFAYTVRGQLPEHLIARRPEILTRGASKPR